MLFAAAAAGQSDKGAGNDGPPGPKVIPGANDAAANNAAVDTASYIIGPNDVLAIEVFREKDWSGYYQVRTDGMISIGLVGEMKAAGLTPKQLQAQFTEALKSCCVRDPSVNVSVYDVRSKQYTITGGVKRPGPYPLIKNPTTVFDAIMTAGGFLDGFINESDIKVLRGGQTFKFNYKDYVKGKNRDKNIPLENGDAIIVRN